MKRRTRVFPKNAAGGFTLIELMIAVVVVGILAAIAYPSYIEQVRKSRRADAKAALLTAAQTMERYYTENNSYAGAAANPSDGGIIPDHAPVDRPHADRTYDISFSQRTATGFTIQATRTGTQASDTTCGDYTLTNTGMKGVTVGSVATCW